MSNQSRINRKGLTVKDLVTIGIFTALLFVTMPLQELRHMALFMGQHSFPSMN